MTTLRQKQFWLTAERATFSVGLLASQIRPLHELAQHGQGALKVPLASPVPAASALVCHCTALQRFIHSCTDQGCDDITQE